VSESAGVHGQFATRRRASDDRVEGEITDRGTCGQPAFVGPPSSLHQRVFLLTYYLQLEYIIIIIIIKGIYIAQVRKGHKYCDIHARQSAPLHMSYMNRLNPENNVDVRNVPLPDGA